MQEHLIPQDITNYKFHLIGELDLVQFCEILVGIIGGVIIFRFNWPAFVKWPLIIIVVSVGLVAAFFPIADRPLSHWLKVYFGGLFAPTKFYWRKKVVVPAFFDFVLSDQHKAFLEATTTFNEMPVKPPRALSYFDTLAHNQQQNVDELEVFSETKLSQVASNLTIETKKAETEAKTAPIAPPTKMVIRPNVKSEQVERARQIITPSQKTLDQFLSNTSIFKPKTNTAAITSIGDSLKPNLSWPTKAESVTQGTPTATNVPASLGTPPATPQIPLTTVPAAAPEPTPTNQTQPPIVDLPSIPTPSTPAATTAVLATPTAAAKTAATPPSPPPTPSPSPFTLPTTSSITLPNLNSNTTATTTAPTSPTSSSISSSGIILPKLG